MDSKSTAGNDWSNKRTEILQLTYNPNQLVDVPILRFILLVSLVILPLLTHTSNPALIKTSQCHLVGFDKSSNVKVFNLKASA
jgi:hypothetical protein